MFKDLLLFCKMNTMIETPAEIIELSETVRVEWYLDRQIVCYTLLSSSRQTVDTWAKKAIRVLNTWDENQPYLALYDVSKIVALTPYGRTRSQEIAEVAQRVRGAYAVVLSDSVLSHVIRLFVERRLRKQRRTHEHVITHSKAEALEWLQARIKDIQKWT